MQKGSRRKKQRFQQHLRMPGGLCASACAGVAVAFGLQHFRMVVVRFVRSTVFPFWGHATRRYIICPQCVGLHFGEREGLLAAAGSGKSGCSSCFADASEQGVSPRLEVGGSACFALALPSLCARSPGCGCFCLRLDFQVTVSVRGKSTLGSSCLPLARGSCRAVGFRQDECRPGASAWACCVWFVALLHVRGSRRAFSWGPPFVRFGVMFCSQQGSSCGQAVSTVLACSTSGSGRGFRSREALGWLGFTQIWSSIRGVVSCC